jgi:hypothetical protein
VQPEGIVGFGDVLYASVIAVPPVAVGAVGDAVACALVNWPTADVSSELLFNWSVLVACVIVTDDVPDGALMVVQPLCTGAVADA